MIIGGSGCGNYYFLSASGAFPGVRIYEHETGEASEVASDINGYYEHIRSDKVRTTKAIILGELNKKKIN